MADYLVTPIKGCWKNWQELARRANVSFSEKDMKLADVLFHANPYPVAKPQVICVREVFGPTRPASEPSRSGRGRTPVHPVVMLTLMTGLLDVRSKGHREFTYRLLVSPHPLWFPYAKNYFFVLNGGNERRPKWRGTFITEREGIGRAMYVYGDKYTKGFDKETYFVPDSDGQYGPHVTCF
jgi:hypothetical protein